MRKLTIALVAASLTCIATAAQARNIVITNDDGLTSNVVALYDALKKDGHDVIVSVPCKNQSGMGAAILIARPLAPLADACLNAAAEAGDAGAGSMTRKGMDADFYYVDGTPVMALVYGLDIVAAQRWGKEPDLVLSGPNEGQNVGAIILSSGTVSAAQYAAVSGLPAIALSAGPATEDDELDGPQSAKVGALTAQLVSLLDKRADGGAMLPDGFALNVNFPDNLDNPVWKVSRIGTYNAYKMGFVQSMVKEASPTMAAMAKARGMELPDLPGISFGFNDAKPSPDQMLDESVVYKTAIAVSPMQAGYEYRSHPKADWLAGYLTGLTTPAK